MKLWPLSLPVLCGLHEGPRQHEQKHSLGDHEMLWNTAEDSDIGGCTLTVLVQWWMVIEEQTCWR